MDMIQNPGSALGEAIGAHMEMALNTYLEKLVKEHSCHLITKGQPNPKTKKNTKLLLFDNFGTSYNIDGVIANESMQPLILLEYKYIRYKKHNRDKGSWLCTAHTAIRKRYHSIRSSFAILAGNWSSSSIAMMKSHDINIFIIPFLKISKILKKTYNIEFDWGVKDRNIANDSWIKYNSLTERQKIGIGKRMISEIKDELALSIDRILDNSRKRSVKQVTVEIKTNLGEVKIFDFPDIESAFDFLEDFTIEEMLNHSDSFTLFDKPKIEDE